MKSGIWIKLQSDNKNDKNPAGNGVTVVPQDFILEGDKTPTSIGGELQQFSLGGSPISFQDNASGGLQRCADVLCHAKHDAHLAASTPRRT